LADFKDGFSKTSLKEKAILGADAIVNRKENSLANVARSQEAHNLKDYQQKKMAESKSYTSEARPFTQRAILPLSDYKNEARDYLKKQNAKSASFRKMNNAAPEAKNFLKSRANHVINPIPKVNGANFDLILERKKINPREKVAVKKPFIQKPNLKGDRHGRNTTV